MRGTTWYRRMGDIPGLDYEPPIPVDRKALPGHNATAEVERLEYLDEEFGRPLEMLKWTIPGVEYPSGSPASDWRLNEEDQPSGAAALQRVFETLELPGEPTDYHFAIQNTAGYLANSLEAYDSPDLDDWAEWLWWLDIRLAKACRAAITFERAGSETQVSALAFPVLIGRYLDEGWLQGALDVAKIAVEIGQRSDHDELMERMEALRAEDEH